MKFLYGLGGANIPVIKEFEISKNMKIEAGGVIRCTTDGVLSHSAVGSCIGVAAEDHSGKEDILNKRANGTKLRVDITKDAVYSVPAPRVTAVTGTKNSFTCAATGISNNLSNGYVVLVQKGENSENTDSVGVRRRIDSVTISSGTATFNVTSGAKISQGDIYAIIPYVGFKGMVAEDHKNFACTGSSVVCNLYVIRGDEKTCELEVLLEKDYIA